MTGFCVPLIGSKMVAAASPLVMSVRLPAALSTDSNNEVMKPSTQPVTACRTRSEINPAVLRLVTLTASPGARLNCETAARARAAASPRRTTWGMDDEEKGGTKASQEPTS